MRVSLCSVPPLFCNQIGVYASPEVRHGRRQAGAHKLSTTYEYAVFTPLGLKAATGHKKRTAEAVLSK